MEFKTTKFKGSVPCTFRGNSVLVIFCDHTLSADGTILPLVIKGWIYADRIKCKLSFTLYSAF